MNVSPTWAVGTPASLDFGSAGGTYSFAQHVVDPHPWEVFQYSLVSAPPVGYSINPTTGVLTALNGAPSGTVVVRVVDSEFTFADHTCSVSVAAVEVPGVVVPTAVLQAAGYVVVTASPYNADPTGVVDSTAAIQSAMDYCYTNSKPLWFPSGTYRVRDTLRGYEYQLYYLHSDGTWKIRVPTDQSYRLYGAQYPSRPVIKLDSGLSAFSSQSAPRPILHLQNYEALPVTTFPPPSYTQTKPAYSTPYTIPTGFKETSPNAFGTVICGIDFDLGGNPGADGVSFNGAQRCLWSHTKIIATGANRGVQNTPGQGSCTHNLEVVGGRIPVQFSGGQGPAIIGLKVTADSNSITCVDHTTQAVVTLVGFEFSRPTPGTVISAISSVNSTMSGTYVLVDGSVSVNGGTAFLNSNANNLYIRNVYVSGTNDLVKSGSAVTWSPLTSSIKRIDEYCCSNPNGVDYVVGNSVPISSAFKWSAFIDGSKLTSLEPVRVAATATTIPNDIRSRHVGKPTRIDDGPYVDIRDTGATTASALAGINAAIAQAKAAGHGRVLIPAGRWTIASKLTLDADSRIFGVDCSTSFIVAGWNAATTTEYIIDTPDSVNGTAKMSLFQVEMPTPNTVGPWHNYVRWRVGRRSSMFGMLFDHVYINPDQVLPQRKMWVFEGSGGGQHWSCEQNGRGVNGLGTRVVHINGTSQPLSIYGLQVEIAKGDAPAPSSLTNVEVTNAQNVRLYMTKREGNGGTLLVNGNSSNIAWYGQSGARGEASYPYFHVTDATTNILIAGVGAQSVNSVQTVVSTKGMLRESGSVGSVYQPFPNGVSLYKRGTINDSLMVHT